MSKNRLSTQDSESQNAPTSYSAPRIGIIGCGPVNRETELPNRRSVGLQEEHEREVGDISKQATVYCTSYRFRDSHHSFLPRTRIFIAFSLAHWTMRPLPF